MTTVVLTMPDDPDEMPGWLDRQIVGRDLIRLTAELGALHGPPSSPTTLDALLSESRRSVLENGLAALPRPAFAKLLKQPLLMLSFQELVFAEGGPYWDSLIEVPGESVGRVSDRVESFLANEPTVAPARRAWYRHPLAVAIPSIAAAVLVTLFVLQTVSPKATAPVVAWGWASPNGLAATGDDAAIFHHLGSKAKEWFKKRPETPETLARRLGEFRDGCSALLLDRTLPLSPAGRAWLDERCQKWAAEIDSERRQLETTRDTLSVRTSADDTINRIAAELEERAARG